MMPDMVCGEAAVILPSTPKQDGAGVGEKTSSCSSQSGSMSLEEQVMQTLEMLWCRGLVFNSLKT